MLKNYLHIAWRTLRKNIVFSYINIFGLAIGMAAFLFITQYVRFERSYESFHTHADNIYRVVTEFYNGTEYVMTDCETFAPLGPFLKDKMPEVTDYVRMYGMDGLISVKAAGQNFLESGIYWSDPSVFNVFTYDVLHGDATKALTAPFEVVLSETMAKKYFGRTNVTDETIEIDKHVYHIKAVIADVPPNTHLKFSFLLSRLSLKTLKPWYPDDRWHNNNEFTFVLTQPGADLDLFNRKLAALASADLKEIIGQKRFVAERIKDIHLYSTNAYEPEPTGNGKVVYYFSLVAIFIITIAWVNYINLSTARAVERAREVGIRKVMGSVKRQLVIQFLSESVIINLLAGIIALVLFQVSFPFFRDLSGQPLSSNLMQDTWVWLLLAGLVGAGSLLSGVYPAFVLASFNPAAVLKGKFHSSAHGRLLRKGLVIFQFSATVVLLISMCTVYLQVKHLRGHDLGMDIEQALVLTGTQLDTPDSLVSLKSEALKAELMKSGEVKSMSRSGSLPGVDMQELSSTSIVRLGQSREEGHGYTYYYISIDADFIPTLNMTLAAGRNFTDGVPNNDQVIINEEAARMLGFSSAEKAVGSKVTFQTRSDTEGSTVIGVLKNFNFRSPKEGHLPMLFYYHEHPEYFAVKLSSDDMPATLASVEAAWKKVYPNSVFNYFFLDEKYDQQYRADTQFGKVMAAFSGLIIFIACLGLFGLSSYTITQRTKEIGIRKVLGSSVAGIVRLLSYDFAKTVFIAALLAVPVAYGVMEEWLSHYAVRINLNGWVFVIAVMTILLLAMVTVSYQTIRTAVANPVDSLKQE
ncbi:MAG TPA: ABC transporter permease [Ohtaekwangia sp.]|nr:ABC transporter permease [Ohtaekwangia sp.]